jgi:hypothetical protein
LLWLNISKESCHKWTNESLVLTNSRHQKVQVGTEELGNIALEDDDLGLVIITKSSNEISYSILEVDTPEVYSRVWVVKSYLENVTILSCLQAAVLGEIESKGTL